MPETLHRRVTLDSRGHRATLSEWTILFLLAGIVLLPFATAVAAEPSRCPAPEAHQFDFWIGEWNVRNLQRSPRHLDDPAWGATGNATDRVYAILGGCAIVEHWRGHLSWGDVHGFSVRAFDPDKKKWVLLLNWPSPKGPSFGILEGVFHHGRGEFFKKGLNPLGRDALTRFTFSDIHPDSLRWDQAFSADGGASWKTSWIMEFNRRDPGKDAPLLDEPSVSRDLCPGPQARAFDFTIGDWVGTRHPAGSSEERKVELKTYPVLDGCGLMEFGHVTGGADEERLFAVRSFLPAVNKWEQYSLRDSDLVFRRWEGEAGKDGGMELVSLKGETGTRIVWSNVQSDQFRREIFHSPDGGKSWTLVSTTEFKRRK